MSLLSCLRSSSTAIGNFGLRRFHQSSRDAGRKFTKQESDQIVQLYKEMRPIAEISSVVGRPYSSVYNKLQDSGVMTPQRPNYTPKEKNLLLRLKETGTAWTDIGLHFPNKSLTALQQTYISLNAGQTPKNERKAHQPYGAEESDLILQSRERVTPPTAWREIARRLGNGRTTDGVRSRYRVLVPDRTLRVKTLNPL